MMNSLKTKFEKRIECLYLTHDANTIANESFKRLMLLVLDIETETDTRDNYLAFRHADKPVRVKIHQ
jgi:hypothetical protein